MRYVKSDNIASGMVLSRPIMNDSGGILAREGFTVNDSFLKHIENMGFQGIYILDDLSKGIEIEDVISPKTRQKAVESLTNGNYNACVPLAKAILDEIRSNPKNTLDLVDIKSFKTYEVHHSVSVCVLSILTGIKLKLGTEQLENLAVAGLLHDIGLLDVQKRIRNSKQVFNDRQMDEMKKHPMYAFETLKEFTAVSAVARNAVLFHHENLDGTGYYGIEKDKLGILPRILRVADTYDAFTATRKHRAAFTPDVAFHHLIDNAGTMYDTDVVRAFVYTLPMYPKGFSVRLDNNEEGLVVGKTEDPEKPIIRFSSGKEVDMFTSSEYRNVSIKEVI